MTGFYRVDYAGQIGTGAGAVAITNGKIAGLDMFGGVIKGTYQVNGTSLLGSFDLTYAQPAQLVNGAQIPAGKPIRVPLNAPIAALNGAKLTLPVPGGGVMVQLTKVADL